MPEMTISASELHTQKKIPVEGMLPAIAHRWSPRAYADRPVSGEHLRLVLESARWAASSSNGQPWRFLVGVRPTGASPDATYERIAATLVPFNRAWALSAPVLMLAFAVAKTPHGSTNHYALFDLGQAVAQMAIQAAALGLATHAMGGFDRDGAQKLIGPAEDFLPGAVIALGHPGDPGQLADAELRARELDPRERKPLEELALSEPGKPFAF
jgi:nitroreductase